MIKKKCLSIVLGACLALLIPSAAFADEDAETLGSDSPSNVSEAPADTLQSVITTEYRSVFVQSNSDSAFRVEYSDATQGSSAMRARKGSIITLYANAGYYFASDPSTNTGESASGGPHMRTIVVGMSPQDLVITVEVKAAITSIWGVPSQITAGETISLTELASVSPSDAPKEITWELIDAGDTGAVLEDATTGLLTTERMGVITVKATPSSAPSSPVMAYFTIFVMDNSFIGSQTPGNDDMTPGDIIDGDQADDPLSKPEPAPESEPSQDNASAPGNEKAGKLLSAQTEPERLASTSDSKQAATLISLAIAALTSAAACGIARKRMS